MSSLIQAGDKVLLGKTATIRNVHHITNGMARLQGIDFSVDVKLLTFPEVTPELLARFILLRKADNVKAVVTWVLQKPHTRRQRALNQIKQFISSEHEVERIRKLLPAKCACGQNPEVMAEAVFELLMKSCSD